MSSKKKDSKEVTQNGNNAHGNEEVEGKCGSDENQSVNDLILVKLDKETIDFLLERAGEHGEKLKGKDLPEEKTTRFWEALSAISLAHSNNTIAEMNEVIAKQTKLVARWTMGLCSVTLAIAVITYYLMNYTKSIMDSTGELTRASQNAVSLIEANNRILDEANKHQEISNKHQEISNKHQEKEIKRNILKDIEVRLLVSHQGVNTPILFHQMDNYKEVEFRTSDTLELTFKNVLCCDVSSLLIKISLNDVELTKVRAVEDDGFYRLLDEDRNSLVSLLTDNGPSFFLEIDFLDLTFKEKELSGATR